MSANNYKVFSRKTVHKNPWFRIVKEDILRPDGHRADYYIFEGESDKNFVVIVAQEKDELYLVKQWRPTLKRYLIEFAAGGIEKNETDLQAAKREFLEETGWGAKKWQYLGKAAVGPGHSKEYGQVFFATGLFKTRGKTNDIQEKTELVIIKRQNFEQMIYNKEIEDGPTLSAYMKYLAFKKRL